MADYAWGSLADIARSLHLVGKAISAASISAVRYGGFAAETIYRAHEYAGADEATASAQGQKMLRVAQDISVTLTQLQLHIKEAKNIARQAVNAIDESDAKRKAARAKLGS